MTAARVPGPRPRGLRRGATIVELSFVLFTLMVLGFGVIEAGHFYFVRQQVQGAAREGARAAIPAGASNSDVTTAVDAVLTSSGFNPSNFTTTVKVNGVVANASTANAGQRIEVSVTAQWGAVGLRPMSLIRSDAVVGGVASMRREGN